MYGLSGQNEHRTGQKMVGSILGMDALPPQQDRERDCSESMPSPIAHQATPFSRRPPVQPNRLNDAAEAKAVPGCSIAAQCLEHHSPQPIQTLDW
jgi:hypothetical protein